MWSYRLIKKINILTRYIVMRLKKRFLEHSNEKIIMVKSACFTITVVVLSEYYCTGTQ